MLSSGHDAMNSFMQACGVTGPLQLRLDRPGGLENEGRILGTPYLVIGREPHTDLVLDHKEVSPRHAYLQWIGGRLHCVDLGSQSGTSLGGQNCRAGWVEPSQTIRIGPYRIRVTSDPDGNSPDEEFPAPGSAGLDLLSPLVLDLSHRGFKSSECRIAGGLALVGSSTDCQVRLLDPGVSNVHCSLISTPMGVWVVDLFGKGGLQVNSVPVRQKRLDASDEIRVGRSTIRVRNLAEMSWTDSPSRSSCRDVPKPEEERVPEVVPPLVLPSLAHEEDPADEPVTTSFWAPSDDEATPEPEYKYEPESEPEFEPEPEPEWGHETDSRWEPSPQFHSPSKKRALEDQTLAALSAKERRASCRYSVEDVEAVLSWWEPKTRASVVLPERDAGETPIRDQSMYTRVMARSPGGHNGTPASRAGEELARDPLPPVIESMKSCTSRALLLDISQTGMLILSETRPPAGLPIWLRLETPRVTEWVEVVVIGASIADDGGGAHQVRLSFRDACPYDFFKVVVYSKRGS
jgi:pSer/pThr/pTyr-binding forkhead associated (FHA) protein